MMVLLSESSDFGVPFGWILKSFEWEIYDLATQEPHERKTRSDCKITVEYYENQSFLQRLFETIVHLFTLSMASRLVTVGPAFVFNTLFEKFSYSECENTKNFPGASPLDPANALTPPEALGPRPQTPAQSSCQGDFQISFKTPGTVYLEFSRRD